MTWRIQQVTRSLWIDNASGGIGGRRSALDVMTEIDIIVASSLLPAVVESVATGRRFMRGTLLGPRILRWRSPRRLLRLK
ncbi:hypothetical protein RHGRI_034317 [Rhododendron griersonianum]|uniref:Uncharacterized protein n=1 Tax=Rhododendron griersonianum TaxID=479676 RepID=A0AAV6I080_9ERIC|nr:hypothetical protein RHGRI_034317 [Rhododendron griersonianum]